MATDEVMKNYFARFSSHEMMFMVFSSDFHGILTNPSFIVCLASRIELCPATFQSLTRRPLHIPQR